MGAYRGGGNRRGAARGRRERDAADSDDRPFADFERLVVAGKNGDADESAVWDLLLNLGRQVSRVRHDLRDVQQANTIIDGRLWGFDDDDPGALGALTAETAGVRRLVRWNLVMLVSLFVAIIGGLFTVLSTVHR